MKSASVQSVELFTGAGGLALGLEAAGWHHKALVEFNAVACRTLRLNVALKQPLARGWSIREGDVRDVAFASLAHDVSLVAGGPPCQPFSLGGKARGMQDARDMFPEAVRAIRELTPRTFIFENVKGLLRKSFATYFNYILLQLSYPLVVRQSKETWLEHLARLERVKTSGARQPLAYNVVYRLLDAADYGIPQHRHRVFIVGFRADLGLSWAFPEKTHSEERLLWDKWVTGDYWQAHHIAPAEREPMREATARQVALLKARYGHTPPPLRRYRTVRDAIADLPPPQEAGAVFNHQLRPGARAYAGHTGSFLDEPSKAIKAGAHGVPGGENMIAFYDGSCRYYTAREAARIQTFPDDYRFSGAWSEAMRQIGNAVPMRLAQAVGESVLKLL